MLVYGECECFVMQMLYVCVLCGELFYMQDPVKKFHKNIELEY